MNRLREKYIKKVVPSLTEKYNYKTPMLVPKIEKVDTNEVKELLKFGVVQFEDLKITN